MIPNIDRCTVDFLPLYAHAAESKTLTQHNKEWPCRKRSEVLLVQQTALAMAYQVLPGNHTAEVKIILHTSITQTDSSKVLIKLCKTLLARQKRELAPLKESVSFNGINFYKNRNNVILIIQNCCNKIISFKTDFKTLNRSLQLSKAVKNPHQSNHWFFEKCTEKL